MARCGCTSEANCQCAVAANPATPDVAVTGDGSAGTPYLVAFTPTPSADADNALTIGSDDRYYVPEAATGSTAVDLLPGGSDQLWLPHRQRATESAPFPLPWADESVTLADRIATFTLFEAPQDLVAARFRVLTGAGAPATGSPARLGLYTVGGGGDLTMVAQSAAATTSVLSAANTFYEPAITNDAAGTPMATFNVVRGTLYAIGVWTDSNGAGTVAGYNARSAAAANRDVKRCRVRSAVDAALPTSVLNANMTDSATALWLAVAA